MAKMSHIFDENDDPNMDPLYRKYIILPELGKRLMSADLNHEKETADDTRRSQSLGRRKRILS